MLQLLNLFFDICLFRRGPQDAPPSLWLMYLCIGASLTMSALINWVALRPGQVWGTFLVTTALLLWMIILLLRWRGQMVRLKQTLTTVFGTDVLLTAANLPLVMHNFPKEVESWTTADHLLAWADLGLLVWSLAVLAHILRHALELPMAVTSLIAVSWLMLAIGVFTTINGSPAG